MVRMRAVLAAAVSAAALAVPLVVSPPARADGGAIGLFQGSDLIAVQPSGGLPGHLVAADDTGGSGADAVVVTDADGANPVAVAVADANALALGPDGRTVWVASGDGEIASFSSDDPAATLHTYPTAGVPCVGDVAVAGDGLIYFVDGCPSSSSWSLRTLDPTVNGRAISDPIAVGRVRTANDTLLQLDNVPAHPDVLAVAAANQWTDDTPEWVDLLSVAGAVASEIGLVRDVSDQPHIRVAQIAMAPDATSVYVNAFGDRSSYAPGVHRYSVAANPGQLGGIAVDVPEFQTGLAVDPTGAYFAASSSFAFRTYGPDSAATLRTFFPTTGPVVGRAVAWLGQDLFTMVRDPSGVYLQRHTDATTEPTTISTVPPVSPAVGRPMRISGVVSDRGTPLGANLPLTMTRTDYHGTTTFHARTGAGGTYSFVTTPRDGLTNTFVVSFAGSPLHARTTASVVVKVVRRRPFLSIHTDRSEYPSGGLAKIAAHLGTTYAERRVAIYAQPAGRSRTVIMYRSVDARGYLHTTYRMHADTVFTAAFAGDLRYAPVRQTVACTTRASVVATERD